MCLQKFPRHWTNQKWSNHKVQELWSSFRIHTLTLDMFTSHFSRIRLRSKHSPHHHHLACFIHFQWGPEEKKTQHVAAKKKTVDSSGSCRHSAAAATKPNSSRCRYTRLWMSFHEVFLRCDLPQFVKLTGRWSGCNSTRSSTYSVNSTETCKLVLWNNSTVWQHITFELGWWTSVFTLFPFFHQTKKK